MQGKGVSPLQLEQGFSTPQSDSFAASRPLTFRLAPLKPSCKSEMTNFTPASPRFIRSRRKLVQKPQPTRGDGLTPLCRNRNGDDYGGNRDDAATLPHLEVGGVEP